MNYLEFLNKEVINKENEKGVVVSFDDINIKIRYFDKEKIYSTKISLKNKYLRFLDEKLNNIIEEEFKEKETHKVERTNHEGRNNKFQFKSERDKEIYCELIYKDMKLKELFGYDFEYPPLKKFIDDHTT